ncbi:hypothetical protein HBI56_047750 [Parastagonospora nodorum]|nr:hypothetical protein HBH51_134180 [Parastagonospora nodorum]KAH4178614.1 hypothetical protein HBH43_026450 [Parastagonospora nodorum]KAH4206929.1 hypothetical protein HBI95_110090 [Parastagonospora nodorum]KAH4303536.1 hypothetical protein HBI01_084410 [Parastagonospora nodorum]KAH4319111.1 hypothetical protein HBI02_007110 [Parastagonospora nodorum]
MAGYAVISSSSSLLPASSTPIGYPVGSTTPIGYPIASPSPYPYDIVKPIESLGQCSQTIIFECIADSPCAPNDFPCICVQLSTLGVQAKISGKCSSELAQYTAFQASVCAGGYTPTYSHGPVPTPSHSKPAPPPAPVYNTTVVVQNATTVVPVQVITTHVVITESGKPTTIQTVVPVPVVPTGPAAPPAPPAGYPTGPAPPLFTGAAATVKMGAFAGAIGFLGLVFAGL